MSTSTADMAIKMLKTNKKRERTDMILEPLQVMITLAILGFSPIGTKVNIYKNTLYLHKPSFLQGAWRWYEGDSKDDLYYLFHAIRRYYKWYKNKDNEIYDYILSLAKEGITKLMETYKTADKQSILHTLALYRNILDLNAPELFKTGGNSEDNKDTINLDQVFSRVTSLYNQKVLMIIFSTLKILEETTSPFIRNDYINGLSHMIKPTETAISQWIQTHLTL